MLFFLLADMFAFGYLGEKPGILVILGGVVVILGIVIYGRISGEEG